MNAKHEHLRVDQLIEDQFDDSLLEEAMNHATDRRKLLKIKIKSLAEEARIIRKEEQRSRGWLRDEMHRHRVIDVRQEARASLIAYGLIRGRTMEQMEPKRREHRPGPNMRRVTDMLRKYGPPGVKFDLPKAA